MHHAPHHDAARPRRATLLYATALRGRDYRGTHTACKQHSHCTHGAQVATCKVPFVDMAVTMRDASIPLTVVEWEEWGNPNEHKYHGMVQSFSIF